MKALKKIQVFWKKYNFMHLKGKMPFKMLKIIYFFQKKKYVCLTYLKFSNSFFFLFGLNLLEHNWTFYLLVKYICSIVALKVFLVNNLYTYHVPTWSRFLPSLNSTANIHRSQERWPFPQTSIKNCRLNLLFKLDLWQENERISPIKQWHNFCASMFASVRIHIW